MSEIFICPTGAIDSHTTKDLRKAGIVVVRSTAPERCQFLRASEAVSASDMLWAAMQALVSNNNSGAAEQRRAFVDNLAKLIDAAHQKSLEPPK